MKPNVAIIAGGNSSEIVVSVKSGENIFKAIDQDLFQPWLVHMEGNNWAVLQNNEEIAQIDKSDFSFTINSEKTKIDFAYITIHGTPGEDGILQGYFDMLNIPYSTCNVNASALTFNKWICNNYLKNFGIHVAKSILLTKGDEVNSKKIVKELRLPIFIKPNAGGSSFGVTKVISEEQVEEAVLNAWKESDQAILEEFIEGTEFTCGLVKVSQKELIFPVTEVVPKNEFFDFEAKYTPGVTDEITPARLPDILFKKCQKLSSQVYDLCFCAGIVRVDWILKEDKFYFLEANTVPGMTDTSFIPQQVRAMGYELTTVLSLIIENGISNC